MSPQQGFDPEERNRFNSLLNDISKDVIVILSTHLVEDVRNLCSEMAIMNKGQVLRKGKPNELIAELENKIWSSLLINLSWRITGIYTILSVSN